MIADFHKGKQMYDEELQSFNLRSFVLIRVSSDKYYSVLLCGEFISDQFNSKYHCIFLQKITDTALPNVTICVHTLSDFTGVGIRL